MGSKKVRILKYLAMCVAVAIYLVLSGFLLILDFKKENKVAEVIETVPEIRIALKDVTLDEINAGPKRVEYVGNEMVLTDGENETYFGNVEIRGRGNASWLMDKKSYRIKLSEKVNLFELGKIKKWAMISNGTDASSMRNDLGYYVANLLYENYPIRGEFVKFVVDGRSLGLYYMSNLVAIDKNLIDLRDPFGILVEIDDVYCRAEEKYRIAKMSDCISVDDVVMDENIDEALDEFMNEYNEFEKMIQSGNYAGAAEKMDMTSLANYFLLSEFSSNPDAYVTSWFLYKDGKKDKIHAGVGWDFDGAFGNEHWWERDDELYSPTELMARMKILVDGWDDYEGSVKRCKMLNGALISPTMCYVMDMPEFRDLVSEIYQEKLMRHGEELISYIRSTAAYIRDEAVANNELWGKGDFDEAVDYLIWWMEARFDYFDELFGGGWPEPAIL